MARVDAPSRDIACECTAVSSSKHVPGRGPQPLPTAHLPARPGAQLTSAKIPPPHPTSSTSFPSSHRLPTSSSSRCIDSRMNCTRAGFIRCKRANSPVGSHQCAERAEKCAISEGEMVLVGGGAERREEVQRVRISRLLVAGASGRRSILRAEGGGRGRGAILLFASCSPATPCSRCSTLRG